MKTSPNTSNRHSYLCSLSSDVQKQRYSQYQVSGSTAIKGF